MHHGRCPIRGTIIHDDHLRPHGLLQGGGERRAQLLLAIFRGNDDRSFQRARELKVGKWGVPIAAGIAGFAEGAELVFGEEFGDAIAPGPAAIQTMPA